APNFQVWATEKDPGIKDRTFPAKGKDFKAKGKTPAFKWWEYSDKMSASRGEELLWYSCAAVYDFPDKEIAIVATVPVLDKKGVKAEEKHYKWQTTMTQSLEVIEGGGEGEDIVSATEAKKEQFANNPERKAELETAKKNIANLKGWDYFTTPDYIVLYS